MVIGYTAYKYLDGVWLTMGSKVRSRPVGEELRSRRQQKKSLRQNVKRGRK